MKRMHLLGIFILGITVSGCGCFTDPFQVRIDEGVNPWTHLRMKSQPSNFQFVIVSDRTGGRRPGVFADAIRKVNLLQPEFVICVGDLIEGYTEDRQELQKQWQELDELVAQLDMPFFYVPGNHDISNPVMRETWQQRYGRSYYHFIYHKVLFLCLNSESGEFEKSGHLSQGQLKYFQQILKRHQNVRYTLVFLHKPLWETNPKNWAEFEALLGDREYMVFAGHKHTYAKQVRNGRTYIRLGTTGGNNKVWSVETDRSNAIRLGKFDHIVWVTMSEEGPRPANLILDGIWDEDVTPFFIASTLEFLKRQLDQGRVIQSTPIPVAEDLFREGQTKVHYTNFAPLPLTITLSVQNHGEVKIMPATMEMQVLPFSTKTIRLAVTADSAVSPEKLTPVVLTSQLRYSLPLKQPYTCTLTHTIPFRKIPSAQTLPKAKRN